MQEAKAAGCRSSAEVDRYLERKRKKEVEEGVPRKGSSQIGPMSQESLNIPASSESLGIHSNRKPCSQAILSSDTNAGVPAFSAGELLSEPVSFQISVFERNSLATLNCFISLRLASRTH